MPSEYRPRLSVEIDEETQKRIQHLVPWGLLGPTMRVILVDILDFIDEVGPVAIAALIDGKIKSREILLAKARKEEPSSEPR
jgi:hypothetical protein